MLLYFVFYQNAQSDEMVRKYQADLLAYQERHSHTNSEFTSREERIQQLEYELEEYKSELQIKNRQIADMQDNMNELKIQLTSLREQNVSAEKEVQLISESHLVVSGTSVYYLSANLTLGDNNTETCSQI